jgi:ABC-type multidrug transport system fused ATPase/permease subunit
MRAITNLIETILPQLLCYVSMIVYATYLDVPLLPSQTILMISYYNTMSQTFACEFMKAVQYSINATVSFDRIKVRAETFPVRRLAVDFALVLLKSYLMEPESETKPAEINQAKKSHVTVNGLSAAWDDDQKNTLRNVSFEVDSTELLGVVGPTGSGKSSLLMALLGEIPTVKSGTVDISGTTFYVSQEPWIFSATVKENILFGKTYDKEKFDEIVDACMLRDDLGMFKNGANTFIGEKGVNLSGGQRARISLARALYSDADVYLLDDPLSAVDANVAKRLYDESVNLRRSSHLILNQKSEFL